MKPFTKKHETTRLLKDEIVRALELVITCPKCGGETDIWSADDETFCIFCSYKVFERETTVH